MHATEIEGVELAAYHLKQVAYSWFELWEDSYEEGSPPARWSEFADAFINHFLHAETRATRAVEFENLKQDMNYGKMVAFAQAIENRKLKNRIEREGNRKTRSTGNMVFSQCIAIRAQAAAEVESFQAQSGKQRILSMWSVGREIPAAAKVSVPHMRENALRGLLLGVTSRQGAGRGTTQSSNPTAATSSAPSPTRGAQAPIGRGVARGGAKSSGGPSRFYAMSGR
uniref:Uncharacterized protein LOC104248063 n=1 Tax=Nicotiana sylvestris TaxID=4096 RepID=A0A1U7YHE6_NICSY|nr:PREDICTED: uncharacterized protein LOC104248063 [Nicotiana sylvestris]